MKRFIFKLTILLGILILADVALGGVFKLYDFTKSGEIGKINKIMREATPELLILGSSRASHHYNPSILQDSLNISVLNAGLDGHGLPFGYGFFLGVSKRTTPQYIICDLHPLFDMHEDKASSDVSALYPYINIDGIDRLIFDFEPSDRIKTKSSSYRLNSALFRLLPSIISNRPYREDGYLPLKGCIDTVISIHPKVITQPLDSNKIKYLQRLVKQAQAKGCRIILTVSPMFSVNTSLIEAFKDEIDIFSREGIIVLWHLDDSRFVNHREYFQDATHMNQIGTDKYTRIIASELKAL